jgi:four helix bundle protein
MHRFKELIVWQKARVLTREVYVMTKDFPADDRFELTSQIRRSVVSIPSNIAEGSGRGTDREFKRFLDIALSSAFELETQLILAYDLGYMVGDTFEGINAMIIEVQRMIVGFKNSLTKIDKA